jgi:hypothetical protein
MQMNLRVSLQAPLSNALKADRRQTVRTLFVSVSFESASIYNSKIKDDLPKDQVFS